MDVLELITAQQVGRECTPVYMVGQQLKDICREDPHCAEVVAQDLQNKSMSLDNCEKKIKAWADAQKRKGNCVCVPPDVAEKIIREFYGLPERAAEKAVAAPPASTASRSPFPSGEGLGLLDLI